MPGFSLSQDFTNHRKRRAWLSLRRTDHPDTRRHRCRKDEGYSQTLCDIRQRWRSRVEEVPVMKFTQETDLRDK